MKTCKEAKKYIKNLRLELAEKGLIEKVDDMALMIIEVTYHKFITATNFILDNGTTYTKHTREGDLITEDYPQVKHQLDAQIQLLKFAQEFGLTASSRKRVKDIAIQKDEGNPITEFFTQK